MARGVPPQRSRRALSLEQSFLCVLGELSGFFRDDREVRLAVRRGEAAVGVERAAAPLDLIALGAQGFDPLVERHGAGDFAPDRLGALEADSGGAAPALGAGESRYRAFGDLDAFDVLGRPSEATRRRAAAAFRWRTTLGFS